MSTVLVVATARKTRGGISSVVKAHECGEQWTKYHCKWIETHVDRSSFAKIFVLMKGLARYLMLLPKADLVHIHLSEPTSARRKLVFFKLAKWFGKKTMVHFHSFSPDTTINSKYSDLYKYLFSNADAVVVLSNYWKEEVNAKYHLGDKVKVIYNPCPKLDNSAQYERTKSILYAGTLNQRKGYADFIKAFAKIAQQHSDWSIVLAGNGEIEQARELAQSLGIEKQVKLLGWVSGEYKDRAYKEASAFCLPSYAEGFPMAVLDAWAYGLPVITTPVGGIPDIAEDEGNMLLFNPGEVDKLAECLDRIISDDALRNRLATESVCLASTAFNIDSINSQIGALYAELLEKD